MERLFFASVIISTPLEPKKIWRLTYIPSVYSYHSCQNDIFRKYISKLADVIREFWSIFESCVSDSAEQPPSFNMPIPYLRAAILFAYKNLYVGLVQLSFLANQKQRGTSARCRQLQDTPLRMGGLFRAQRNRIGQSYIQINLYWTKCIHLLRAQACLLVDINYIRCPSGDASCEQELYMPWKRLL